MCYTITPYHSCGCYGKPVLQNGGCIRATSQPGLKAGCWDRSDLGVENVDALCPTCQRGGSARGSSGSDSDTPRFPSANSGFLQLPPQPGMSRSGSNASTVTTSSARSFASGTSMGSRRPPSTADNARSVLSLLPIVPSQKCVGTIEQVGPTNAHWKALNS